jgi:hypothetical protein
MLLYDHDLQMQFIRWFSETPTGGKCLSVLQTAKASAGTLLLDSYHTSKRSIANARQRGGATQPNFKEGGVHRPISLVCWMLGGNGSRGGWKGGRRAAVRLGHKAG